MQAALVGSAADGIGGQSRQEGRHAWSKVWRVDAAQGNAEGSRFRGRGTLAVWGDGLMEQSLECQATEPKEQEEATGP